MGTLLRRVGAGILVLAAALYFVPTYVITAPPEELVSVIYPRARGLAVFGGIAVLVGFGIDGLGRLNLGRKCARCAHAAVGGSVFCAHHRDELAEAARHIRADRH